MTLNGRTALYCTDTATFKRYEADIRGCFVTRGLKRQRGGQKPRFLTLSVAIFWELLELKPIYYAAS